MKDIYTDMINLSLLRTSSTNRQIPPAEENRELGSKAKQQRALALTRFERMERQNKGLREKKHSHSRFYISIRQLVNG